jgi:hypothetical protein
VRRDLLETGLVGEGERAESVRLCPDDSEGLIVCEMACWYSGAREAVRLARWGGGSRERGWEDEVEG